VRPERIEEASSDTLGAYLASVPRSLSAAAWARWRGKNPPPYLRPEARRNGRCTLCGGELGAILGFCHRCSRREMEYVRQLQKPPEPVPPVVGRFGRALTEEWRDYPDLGPWRPACRKLWYVVRDAHGAEVTRDLRRDIAERYL
jgi:hypothetical protein